MGDTPSMDSSNIEFRIKKKVLFAILVVYFIPTIYFIFTGLTSDIPNRQYKEVLECVCERVF